MAFICFVGTYKPIICGIADYTGFITRASPAGKWSVLSFDLEKYGASLSTARERTDQVWYGIPGRYDFSAAVILQGLKELGLKDEDTILWFQHDDLIWADSQKFVTMLMDLDLPKVVTFHTLHFQSSETPTGLRKYQYNLLQSLLPHVQAITVFSHGVYDAVTSAFPEHRNRVYVVKHGIHSYPAVSKLSRKEAKERLNDFLLSEAGLDQATRDALRKQRTFLDPDTSVIGQTGFLCPLKHSESLYLLRDKLQQITPHKRIAAVRIGMTREESQKIYAGKLRREQNGRDSFLLETWLPQDTLALAQRAFDVNFYWPTECTQSGIMAHALGAGAMVAGRDLEGVGETLKEAGGLVDTDLRRLLLKIREIIINPALRERMEGAVLKYAAEFSWKNQSRRHYELAERILRTKRCPSGKIPNPNI